MDNERSFDEVWVMSWLTYRPISGDRLQEAKVTLLLTDGCHLSAHGGVSG